MHAARGEGRFAWSDFHKWSESDRALLLVQSEQLYNIVPMAALHCGQLEAIGKALEGSGVNRL